jgi:hypothetical protein
MQNSECKSYLETIAVIKGAKFTVQWAMKSYFGAQNEAILKNVHRKSGSRSDCSDLETE